MLAGVGVLGLALGFAFQDLASNFISGIMIAIRKPMDLGDIIEIDSVMGTVDEIKILLYIIYVYYNCLKVELLQCQ